MSENRTGAAPGTAAERRRARARKRLLTLGIGCAVLAVLIGLHNIPEGMAVSVPLMSQQQRQTSFPGKPT